MADLVEATLVIHDFTDALATAVDAHGVQSFMRPDDFMSCPCFVIDLPGFYAKGQCWRPLCSEGHQYCCVHVRGDERLAARLRDLLTATEWYGEWALSVTPQRRAKGADISRSPGP